MPDAAYYCGQSALLRETADRVDDPAVATRLRSLATDYDALAIMLDVTSPATCGLEHRDGMSSWGEPDWANQDYRGSDNNRSKRVQGHDY